MRRPPLTLLLVTAAVAVAPASPAGAAGALTQLPDPFGCHIGAPAPGGSLCTGAQGLPSVHDIATSADGKSIYTVGGNNIVAFQRDPVTGQLGQLGGQLACVRNNVSGALGGDPDCAAGRALGGARRVAVSPDDRSVYVVSSASNAVAVFNRPPGFAGALAQLGGTNGCMSQAGVLNGAAGACRSAKAMTLPQDIAISPDGKHVYVASAGSEGGGRRGAPGSNGGLTVLKRTTSGPALGRLTFVECFGAAIGCKSAKGLRRPWGVAVSPDVSGPEGETTSSVYVASPSFDAVAAFARAPKTGKLDQLGGSEACVTSYPFPSVPGCWNPGKALGGARRVTVSRGGDSVYVSSFADDGGTAIFTRDFSNGALVGQPGCVNDDGADGCVEAAGHRPRSMALSPDGRNLYAASSSPGVVTAFDRATTGLTGLLTQLPGADGCLSADPASACGDVHDMEEPESIAVSPDGRHVYAGNFIGPIAIGKGVLTSFARSPGPPQCVSKIVDNTGGSGADIQLECTDPLNKPLTYSIVSQPDKGNVTIDQATAVAYYVPQASFIGPDPFTYKASNGTQESNVATITVNNVAG